MQFIDYMNLHLYVGSQDWPNNNWTAYRNRAPGGKFFFTTWDAEYTLHDPTINRTGVSDANSPGQLWSALKNNAEFRLRFADRAHALMFNGGPLTPGPAAARYTALVNQIEDPLVAESAAVGRLSPRRPPVPRRALRAVDARQPMGHREDSTAQYLVPGPHDQRDQPVQDARACIPMWSRRRSTSTAGRS